MGERKETKAGGEEEGRGREREREKLRREKTQEEEKRRRKRMRQQKCYLPCGTPTPPSLTPNLHVQADTVFEQNMEAGANDGLVC